MKAKYVFVVATLAALAGYFIVRPLFAAGPGPAEAGHAPTIPSVQVTLVRPVLREAQVTVRGRTEAARSVVARSETAGVVVSVPATEGAFVRRGQVLCRLAVDARQAELDQARAALRSRRLQRQAAAQLAEKGYRSQTQVLEAQANLDAAQAAVEAAEIALRQVDIRAPFAGVFDHRDAEVGAYLAPGQACGSVIELDPLLVVGDLPETEAGRIRPGALAEARLVSGQVLRGRIRYVARDADAQTRTYRVEVGTANPGLDVRAGLSAEIHIAAGRAPAHLVPLSALVLDSAGRQGVRHVLADQRVAFTPVDVVAETEQGVWVGGLSGPVRVITVGQSYVTEGQKVRVAGAG